MGRIGIGKIACIGQTEAKAYKEYIKMMHYMVLKYEFRTMRLKNHQTYTEYCQMIFPCLISKFIILKHRKNIEMKVFYSYNVSFLCTHVESESLFKVKTYKIKGNHPHWMVSYINIILLTNIFLRFYGTGNFYIPIPRFQRYYMPQSLQILYTVLPQD